MIWQRFFKMKRPRPADRQDPAVLSRTARESADVAMRRDACRRLTSLEDLRVIAASDADAGVRDIALARYRHLLCCDDDAPELSLEARLRELAATDSAAIIAQVATTAAAAELRRAAIERTAAAETLSACALNDPLSSNRCAAVERLADKQALERIAKQIGKKDKRVYRLTRQKLRMIAEQEALPGRVRDRCEDLCERLERLGRFGQWDQDRGVLDLIEREWAEIAPVAPEDHRARYQHGREAFLAAYAAQREQNATLLAAEQAQVARRTALDALLGELTDAIGLDDEAAVDALYERAAQVWAEGPPLPPSDLAALEPRYKEAVAALARHRDRLAQQRRANERARELSSNLEGLLAESQPLSLPRVRPAIDEAAALEANADLGAEARERLRRAIAELEQRLDKQRRHAEERIERLQPKLAALTAALDEGELKRAEPLLQSLQSGVDLAQASGLPHKDYAEILRHINEAGPRVKELQRWRRWGTDQKREALCQAVNELLEREASAETLTDQLRDIQAAWKALDHGGAPADRRRWERFHSAAERVYERCRPYLEQQASERDDNRRARERLCGEIEQFLDQVDWERVDWKKAVAAAREMRRDWGRLGPTDGRHRRALEQRFRSSMKRLEQRLDGERLRNRRLREDLIAEVEALSELPDLDRAIEATKAYQRRWHTTVAGRKADENALWDRFRAACDRVFDRRRAQLEARETALKENLATRAAVCADAEALARAPCSPVEMDSAIGALEKRWRDTASLPVSRQDAQTLSRRWREARASVQEALAHGRDKSRRAALELLAHQAELCAKLEGTASSADESGSTDLAAVRSAWSQLATHTDQTLQAAITARFEAALEAAEEGRPTRPETLAENRRERERLCLQLEILAQVESPAELANERLALQVNRLSERMVAREEDPLANAAGLLSKWYLCGPAPDVPELERRFARVLTALAQPTYERPNDHGASRPTPDDERSPRP